MIDVALLETGERAARDARFAGLVERQSRFVFQVAYALLRNSYHAEDVVQETFLKLYRGGAWETLENGARISGACGMADGAGRTEAPQGGSWNAARKCTD
jgi:Sigma-70 region 2